MVVEVLCTITLGVPISNHKIHNSGNYVEPTKSLTNYRTKK